MESFQGDLKEEKPSKKSKGEEVDKKPNGRWLET